MQESTDANKAEPEMSQAELEHWIRVLCASKAEEFRMIGYEAVTGEDIWECVSERYRKSGLPPLYRIVNDILSLKATQWMNWVTMGALRGARLE